MTNTPTDLLAFVGGWVAMTAAMMLPSAAPFVFSFARAFRRDRSWPLAAVLLVAVYLAVWLAFGAALFALSGWIPVWVAIGAAVVYMLSPLQRIGEKGCAELCRRFEGAPDGATRAAVVRGGAYGLFCVGCTAGVMVAVFFLAMSDLRLMAAAAVGVFLLKVRGWYAMA